MGINWCQGMIFKQMSPTYFGNIDRGRSRIPLNMDDMLSRLYWKSSFFVLAPRYSCNKNESWLKIKINYMRSWDNKVIVNRRFRINYIMM